MGNAGRVQSISGFGKVDAEGTIVSGVEGLGKSVSQRILEMVK